MKKNIIKTAVPFALTMLLSTASFNIAAVQADFAVSAETINLSDGVSVKTYAELSEAVTSGKSKIYVLNDIKMQDGIVLNLGNQSIIGVADSSGVIPVLDFENMTGKNDIVHNKSADADVAVKITSPHNVLKNLIIEKGHDNGVLIKGDNATGNHLTNCILRYNNDSGIQITGGACGNILNGIYSYRNCDVFTLGGNADGFAIKLSAGPADTESFSSVYKYKNTCINCYAWENGDDGWDSFDKAIEDQSDAYQAEGGRWTIRNDYTNCMCWSNGTPENCLGYTDYSKGLKLDESLPFVMRFKKLSSEEKYSEFVSKYNNGTLCSKADSGVYFKKLDEIFGAVPTSEGELLPSQIANENWGGNPNGFKFGSKFTNTDSKRYVKNCISFDHNSYGFDKNNSAAKIYAENCISFGNGKCNYHLEGYTAYRWNNIYGRDGEIADDLPKGAKGINISVEEAAKDKEIEIRNAAEQLKTAANENKFVNSGIFTSVF